MSRAVILRTGGIRTLAHSDTFWMSDAKIHKRSMRELAEQCFGDVLVGGYGMGIVQRYLTSNPAVLSITTVEICGDVIAKMAIEDQWIWGRVIVADLLEWTPDRQYDCVVGDIWADAPTMEDPLYVGFLERAPEFVKSDGKIITWEGSWG